MTKKSPNSKPLSKPTSSGKNHPYKPDKQGTGKIPGGKKMDNGKRC